MGVFGWVRDRYVGKGYLLGQGTAMMDSVCYIICLLSFDNFDISTVFVIHVLATRGLAFHLPFLPIYSLYIYLPVSNILRILEAVISLSSTLKVSAKQS